MKKEGFSIRIILLLAIICVSCEKELQKELFSDLGIFIDSRDGQEYQMVEIGDQVWMKENLNYTADSGNWIYDNDPANASIYGRLYNWETACEVCPDGWHLPSDDEWTILSDYAGGDLRAGSAMREEGNVHWEPFWKEGTNESGFTALPGGFAVPSSKGDDFGGLGGEAHFWSSTEGSASTAWDRWMGNKFHFLNRFDRPKVQGVSVRCIKN